MPALPSTLACVYMSITHAAYASMVTYVHVSICALNPCTNACIHVNRPHNALSTITCVSTCHHRLEPKSSSCVYIDNNLYVYAHLQQKSVSCVHVHQSLMYVHACISFVPCMCVYVNRQRSLCIYGNIRICQYLCLRPFN